jgi:lactate permease
VDTGLPITFGYWIAAFTPVLILVVLLVGLRWSTATAAPVALLAAVVVALTLFGADPFDLAVAAGKGIWDAVFVLYVVWPALILYQVAKSAGAFDVIEEGMERVIPSRLLIILTFSWVLSSFLQAYTGFGAPLAVVAPLMVGFGVEKVYAVLLPLLGRTWGNEFGSLGVSWLVTLNVAEVPDHQQTIFLTSLLLWIPNLLAGLAIAWIYGRGWALKRGALAIGVITLVHGGLQLALTPFLPVIGNPIACTVALGAAAVLAKWGPYSREDEEKPNRIFKGGKDEDKGEKDHGEMTLWVAMSPYLVLSLVAVVALLIPPVRALLEAVSVGLPFPSMETGYGVYREPTDAYAAFTPFTHPGTLLVLAVISGYLLYRSRGAYEAEHVSLWDIIRQAGTKALKATTAITAILLVSKVMDHSGQITVLALGIAQVTGDVVYLAVSNMIGVLGALVTSSNTASNILFAPLQATAARAENLSVELVIAAQGAGGAIGNAIAPADILLGVVAVGIASRLGEVLRKAFPWTLLVSLLASGLTLILHFFVV